MWTNKSLHTLNIHHFRREPKNLESIYPCIIWFKITGKIFDMETNSIQSAIFGLVIKKRRCGSLLTNNLFLNATENIFYSASSLKQQSADRHISFHSDTSSWFRADQPLPLLINAHSPHKEHRFSGPKTSKTLFGPVKFPVFCLRTI